MPDLAHELAEKCVLEVGFNGTPGVVEKFTPHHREVYSARHGRSERAERARGIPRRPRERALMPPRLDEVAVMQRYTELARRHNLTHHDIHVIILGGISELLAQICREQWDGKKVEMARAAESLIEVIRHAPMREFTSAVFAAILSILYEGEATPPPGGRYVPPAPEVA